MIAVRRPLSKSLLLISGLALAAAVLLGGSQADAAGLFNMPTSLRQCLGVGVGPGYHAPMIVGPLYRSTTASQNVQRLPYPPQSPVCHGGFCAGVTTIPNANYSYPPAAPAHRPVHYQHTHSVPPGTVVPPASAWSPASASPTAEVIPTPQKPARQLPPPPAPEPRSPSEQPAPDPLPMPSI